MKRMIGWLLMSLALAILLSLLAAAAYRWGILTVLSNLWG